MYEMLKSKLNMFLEGLVIKQEIQTRKLTIALRFLEIFIGRLVLASISAKILKQIHISGTFLQKYC